MSVLLAIDPGTYQMGLALFVDGELIGYNLIKPRPSEFVDTRIYYILDSLGAFITKTGNVTEIACERATGYENLRPAPAVQTIIQSLRQRAKKAGIPFTTYHPSTVVSAVRLRGLRYAPNKEVIEVGVLALYGEKFQELGKQEQDILDAIAVGVCHLNKTKEKEVLSRGNDDFSSGNGEIDTGI